MIGQELGHHSYIQDIEDVLCEDYVKNGTGVYRNRDGREMMEKLSPVPLGGSATLRTMLRIKLAGNQSRAVRKEDVEIVPTANMPRWGVNGQNLYRSRRWNKDLYPHSFEIVEARDVHRSVLKVLVDKNSDVPRLPVKRSARHVW